jgi:hypothetical protein
VHTSQDKASSLSYLHLSLSYLRLSLINNEELKAERLWSKKGTGHKSNCLNEIQNYS